MEWPNELNVRLPVWEFTGFRSNEYECRSSQTDYLKIETSRFLARHSALLGQGKDQLAQHQDNVTEWDGISGHVADGLISKWGSTIKSP